MQTSFRLVPALAAALIFVSMAPLASSAQDVPQVDDLGAVSAAALHALAPHLVRLAESAPGLVAISVGDLFTGQGISVNGDAELPAASTIKIPVMVEVFRQIAIGRFSLRRTMTLTDVDRDCGYGDLCDAPGGSTYSVEDLLVAMIDDSDNTAANMLIRLVGRQSINRTMAGLGLSRTHLADEIRSDSGDIRGLRTSANDMLSLLSMIAARRIVTPSACDAMLAILAGQRHNDLLPEPLPKDLVIAHKTGTLHDTLNDVGIVELAGAPYVICVLTTHWSDLDDGQTLIRLASLMTYRSFDAVAKERDASNARL